ncbi:MAG: enoyl-CoA hydratase/isomerase family protein [Acidobacteria bacterium]|nr:enoyl-CoA hydratase/isomerase family protein [Acidobacteriota bacterium]
MPGPKTFLYEESHRVARITLNRPDRRNSLTFEIYEELTATLKSPAARDAVRAVVLQGAGPGFCSGGDHDEIIAPLLAADAARHRAFTRLTCDLILAIRNLPKPVVAALHGATVGAGAVLAAASDIRIAADDLRLGFVFVKVGLSGADMGAAWLLPRLVGLGTATQWLLTGEIVDAPAARRAGFLHEIVHAENLPSRAMAWAEKLARGPARALAVTKRSLNLEASMDLETAMRHEAEAQAALMGEGAFAEGFRAFKEKREPDFD